MSATIPLQDSRAMLRMETGLMKPTCMMRVLWVWVAHGRTFQQGPFRLQELPSTHPKSKRSIKRWFLIVYLRSEDPASTTFTTARPIQRVPIKVHSIGKKHFVQKQMLGLKGKVLLLDRIEGLHSMSQFQLGTCESAGVRLQGCSKRPPQRVHLLLYDVLWP